MTAAPALDIGAELTWLGHATFLVRTPGGRRVLIDPWLQGNPSCPASLKDVGPLDAILVTHGHFDHAGEVPAVAKASGAKHVVSCFETGQYFKRKGVETVVDMNKGGTVQVAGLAISMVSADHSCGITDDDGSILYGGAAAGYVIRLENGKAIYHAGDTNVFGDMALIGRLHRPDVALLPIGGHYTMGPREAALAVEMTGAKHVVPMHFGTFPVLSGRPADLRREAAHVKTSIVHDVEPGQTLR